MTTRQKLRRGWLGLLVLAYGGFLLWYGGGGHTITAAEGKILLERVRTSSAAIEHPDVLAAMARLIAQDNGREFYMINLEHIRPGPEAAKADRAYARTVLPALLKHGSMPVYVGRIQGLLIGQSDADFGRVALVRYRSLRDFLAIFTDTAMQAGVDNKFASLSYTEARATSPVISLLAVRLTAACLFGLAGLAGWIALRNRPA